MGTVGDAVDRGPGDPTTQRTTSDRGPHRGALRDALRVVTDRWRALLLTLAGGAVGTLGAALLASNVARWFVGVQRDVVVGTGAVPPGLVVVAYAQVLLALGVTLLLCLGAVLAAVGHVARGACTGVAVAPAEALRTGVRRSAPVAAALALTTAGVAGLTTASLALLAVALVVLPVLGAATLVARVRPAWRPALRRTALVLVPFALVSSAVLRWTAWLPFVVVDGLGVRAALRASGAAYRAQRRATVRTVLGLGAVALGVVAVPVGLVMAGVDPDLASWVLLGGVAALTVLAVVTATVLHARRTGTAPRPLPNGPWRLPARPRLRRLRPAVSALVVLTVLAQSVLLMPAAPAAAAGPGPLPRFEVDTLLDDPDADLTHECTTESTRCSLRGALARAADLPGATVTFTVSGTVELGDVLTIGGPLTVDGAGRQVRVQAPADGLSTVAFAVMSAAGAPVVLRDLTVAGHGGAEARGLSVASGRVVVEDVTFTGLRTSTRGSAVSNDGHLTLRNVTFAHNEAPRPDGGTVHSHGTVEVVHGTFLDNQGGGVVGHGHTTVVNSVLRGGSGAFNCHLAAGWVLRGNLSNDGSCAGPGETGRTNLSDHQLGLGTLGDHGGAVPTVSLLDGSLALGGGDPDHCASHDARGEPRPIPPTPCDVGAYQAAVGTTATIHATPDPAPYGVPVHVTVAVLHPVRTPTGSVELTGSGDTLVAALDGGEATFELGDLDVGDLTLVARYVPDGDLEPSERSHLLSVVPQRTTTTLAVDPAGGSSLVGEPVRLTATVANAADVTGPQPEGVVELRSGTDVVATAPLVDGVAVAADVVLPGGRHDLTAAYAGSAHFEASTSLPVSHAVRVVSHVDVAALPSATFGVPFDVDVTVAPDVGATEPTGDLLVDVRTLDDTWTTTPASGVVDAGRATITVTEPLPAGAYHLTVRYRGDDVHEPATSPSRPLTVTPAPTTTHLTGPDGPTVAGQPAPFQAEVRAPGSSVTPEGTVELVVAGDVAAVVPLDDGVAVWAPDDLEATADPHAVVARYVPAPGNWVASTSLPVTHEVRQAGTTTVLHVAPEASSATEPVTLTAVVEPVAPSTEHPRGDVVFRSGDDVLGEVALADGEARLTVTDLAVGEHALTATFVGTPSYRVSASAAVTHVVAKGVPDVDLTASDAAPVHGRAVDLTATVTTSTGARPTGTVTFYDGDERLGAVPLDDGTAVLTVPSLAAGERELSARYHGDHRFAAADGTLDLTVATATPHVRVASVAPGASRWGDTVTVDVQVTSPTGSTPTGEVELWRSGAGAVGAAPVVDGVARVVVDDLGVGRHALVALYRGDANHDAADSVEGDGDVTWHEVGRAVPRLVVRTSDATRYGDAVRVDVEVEAVHGQVPSGQVRIRLQNIGYAPPTRFDAEGRTSAVFDAVPPGEWTVWVEVGEDAWFEAVNASHHQHRVQPGIATLALSTDPARPTIDEDVTVTVAVGPEAAAGVGRVDLRADGAYVGTADVGPDGSARLTTRFATPGPVVLTATYNGFGLFEPTTSAPHEVDVLGRTVAMFATGASGSYGDDLAVRVVLTSDATATPHPTGTVTLLDRGEQVGLAVLGAPTVSGPYATHVVDVPLSRLLDGGSHTLTVVYSGDRWHRESTTTAPVTVSRTSVDASVEVWGRAVAGERVTLVGSVTRLAPPAVAPTGVLRLGIGPASCDVVLERGITGGDCDVVVPAAGDLTASAWYPGDARYLPAVSPGVPVRAEPGTARVTVTAPTSPTPRGPAWNDREPVRVTWDVRGGLTRPTGRVQVWTHEGRQRCADDGVVGACDVRFDAPADGAWVEVRFPGDDAYRPAAGRVTGKVVGCHEVRVLEGRVRTPANCSGDRYLSGTRVELEAPERDAHRLDGWTDRVTNRIVSSPVMIASDRVLRPVYAPMCVTLTMIRSPQGLPLLAPDPQPNCVDPEDPGGHDPAQEVRDGRMRYLAGTEVQLRPYPVRAAHLTGTVRYSGDGVGADGRLVLDRDRTVVAELGFACHRLEVLGPPGVTVGVASSRLDTSGSPLLVVHGEGTCDLPDGGTGYLAGTEVVVEMRPPEGVWLDRWGPVERLGPRTAPPEEITHVDERPDRVWPGFRATHVVTMPAHDAAVTAHASTVVCHPVRVTVRDAVRPDDLTDGSSPASADLPATNCPDWWWQENDADRDAHWYLHGTTVTVTADDGERWAWIPDFHDPQRIRFEGWSGDLTGTGTTQEITVTGPVEATAEWYVPTTCSRVVVRARPAGAGDVLSSGLGDECPPVVHAGGAETPRAPLGAEIALAARPHGSLQTIWTVEGPSVSAAQACLLREEDIRVAYEVGLDRGETKAETERRLMQMGYLPGLTMARIQEEAEYRFHQGWTQEQILDHLQRIGLLTEDGVPVPDRLRPNPCDDTRRDAVLPPGERTLSVQVDGDLVATAHFCQAVDPTVTIVDVDGEARPATAVERTRFAGVFRGSRPATNCPVPGYFVPGTTPVLGHAGTGVRGYVIDGWVLDGVEHPAGPLLVPVTADRSPQVELVVRTTCHALTVDTKFGYTAQPQPDCPGTDPGRNLYAEGTQVVVTAREDSGHVWRGWRELDDDANPAVVTLDAPVTLTTDFRAKTTGEKLQENVVDPVVDAIGVAAKKAVGAISFAVKVLAEQLFDKAVFTVLALAGDALKLGFNAIGVDGKVLDGIVVGLKTPQNVVRGALDTFTCMQEWAWGTSLPTRGDLVRSATSWARSEVAPRLKDVDVAAVVAAARDVVEAVAAGDSRAMTELQVAAVTSDEAAMVLRVVHAIEDDPEKWATGAAEAVEYALDVLREDYGDPFVWEGSAHEAWTTGGDELAQCLADKGRSMLDW